MQKEKIREVIAISIIVLLIFGGLFVYSASNITGNAFLNFGKLFSRSSTTTLAQNASNLNIGAVKAPSVAQDFKGAVYQPFVNKPGCLIVDAAKYTFSNKNYTSGLDFCKTALKYNGCDFVRSSGKKDDSCNGNLYCQIIPSYDYVNEIVYVNETQLVNQTIYVNETQLVNETIYVNESVYVPNMMFPLGVTVPLNILRGGFNSNLKSFTLLEVYNFTYSNFKYHSYYVREYCTNTALYNLVNSKLPSYVGSTCTAVPVEGYSLLLTNGTTTYPNQGFNFYADGKNYYWAIKDYCTNTTLYNLVNSKLPSYVGSTCIENTLYSYNLTLTNGTVISAFTGPSLDRNSLIMPFYTYDINFSDYGFRFGVNNNILQSWLARFSKTFRLINNNGSIIDPNVYFTVKSIKVIAYPSNYPGNYGNYIFDERDKSNYVVLDMNYTNYNKPVVVTNQIIATKPFNITKAVTVTKQRTVTKQILKGQEIKCSNDQNLMGISPVYVNCCRDATPSSDQAAVSPVKTTSGASSGQAKTSAKTAVKF